eukprot:sb/3469505/
MSCGILASHLPNTSQLHNNLLTSPPESPPSPDHRITNNIVTSSRHRDNDMTSPITSPGVSMFSSQLYGEGGLTISFNGAASDLHPLQVKRRIKDRRHSMDLQSLTTGGFVPFQPEVMVSSRRSSLTEGCGNSKKLFSDEEIDRLSALYSSNFDPKKSPPKRRGDDLAARLGRGSQTPLFRPRDWVSANQGPGFPDSVVSGTDQSKYTTNQNSIFRSRDVISRSGTSIS